MLHGTCTTGPESTDMRSLLTRLADVARIDGDGFSFTREMLADDRIVKRKPVESFILKKVTVCLFRKTAISA